MFYMYARAAFNCASTTSATSTLVTVDLFGGSLSLSSITLKVACAVGQSTPERCARCVGSPLSNKTAGIISFIVFELATQVWGTIY